MFRRRVTEFVDMPDVPLDLLFRFLRLNQGPSRFSGTNASVAGSCVTEEREGTRLSTSSRVAAVSDRIGGRRVGIALMVALFCSAFQFFHSFGKAFETQPFAPYLLLEVTLAALIVLATTTVAMELAS